MERVRLDKWLWAARFFKTRALAKAAIEGGKVKLDGERPKVSKEVGVRAIYQTQVMVDGPAVATTGGCSATAENGAFAGLSLLFLAALGFRRRR